MFNLTTQSKIFIAGHRGLVGSAIIRKLKLSGYDNVVVRTRQELDLRDQLSTKLFFESERPDCVFLAAAKVGGIKANYTYPADFIRDNLLIQNNVIDSSWQSGVKRLCLLGSACIYRNDLERTIGEEDFLQGPLEPTNLPYALAKIAGIVMCQSYWKQYGFESFYPMPSNLFGPGDDFSTENSHVLPGLLRKFHDAKTTGLVTCWGDGSALREFLYSDDIADACVFLMQHATPGEIYNVGYGQDFSIKQLVELISLITDYKGEVVWDTSKPNGTRRKLLNSDKINKLGWMAKTNILDGIGKTYEWFLENKNNLRC